MNVLNLNLPLTTLLTLGAIFVSLAIIVGSTASYLLAATSSLTLGAVAYVSRSRSAPVPAIR